MSYCAEDIYKITLEKLAEEGNESAKLALEMAARFATRPIPVENIIQDLKDATVHLHRALNSNGEEWSRATDTHVMNAQSCILEAVASL